MVGECLCVAWFDHIPARGRDVVGEAVCACICLRAGASASEDEIRDFCRGRIAHYKVPRYVRFVDGFPLTVTGKIQKYRIREQMRAELNLTEERHA